MKTFQRLLAYSLLLLPTECLANPTSFKDGWGIMPTYTSRWSDYQVNYSLSSRDAVGLSAFYRNGKDHKATFTVGQYNYLLKRWNEPESQANIYFLGGVGLRDEQDGGDNLAGYGAVEADYETRRIYTLFSSETMQSPGGVGFSRVRGRLGFALYKAPVDELQTWIIGQVDYMPQMEDETTVTPLVRFFYNNFALELGSSTRGEVFVAGMAHF